MSKFVLSLLLILSALGCSFVWAEEVEKEAKPLDKQGTAIDRKREWFPEEESLYKSMVADPRKVSYSVGFRFFDDVISDNTVSVSLGQEIPLYKWHDVMILGTRGDMQLGLAGGAWVVFDFDSKDDWAEIVNADYQVGLNTTFRHGKWSHRFRLYHMSSHLGDEFLLAHPQVLRLNPSFEAIELFSSYNLTDQIRAYGGVGYVVRSDETFSLHPLYAEVGLELRLLEKDLVSQGLHMQPFYAMHFRHWEDTGWISDSTYVLGIEWSKIGKPQGRRTRLYLEYHDGFSLEGQFSKDPTTYLSLNLGVGY